MSDKSRIDEPTGTSTVGHEWDGIEELNTPLPRWWLWTFYACIAWAAVYVVLYPAWPMVNSATRGALEWSSRDDLKREMASHLAKRAPITNAIAALPIAALPGKPELMEAAIQGGGAAFKVHCVQCHGAGGAGVVGLYPSLTDDDWLWGGDLAAIETTLTHGIRNPDHDATRMNMMPAFGRDGILDSAAINDLVSHVRVISRQEKPSAASARGATLFEANCVACHGTNGEGSCRATGRPSKLTDAVWLYGGSREAEVEQDRSYNPRQRRDAGGGRDKLDAGDDQDACSAYVHSLRGGEAGTRTCDNNAPLHPRTRPADNG
jgi:cytochrome c oxidase cbb3-type subunit 3